VKQLKFRLQLGAEDDEESAEEVVELTVLEKDCERLEHLGLTLLESKEILRLSLALQPTPQLRPAHGGGMPGQVGNSGRHLLPQEVRGGQVPQRGAALPQEARL
jgi:hypothetical protein